MNKTLYINTKIRMHIPFGPSVDRDDIVSMSVTFTPAGSCAGGKTFNITGGDIGDDEAILVIPSEDGIETPGSYKIKVLYYDSEGEPWGIPPKPEYLNFSC